ncbi:hypothetical protein M3P05_13105 [Sansalvadorimonas sp. 2012CJ34-2]|uniref:Uncharacterized protein n=1 Tax=Parendozoicomonas callyspongiae TaxID=2942213 RepID=A0ABT0PJE7_9GAMM|nr:hypothetical protein [Sansalvadorimonas sp. 2012CJ34-2]MCL6270862.1 hypothetical protein [Sansalvadorimonas sp. 2012CJ34-2]
MAIWQPGSQHANRAGSNAVEASQRGSNPEIDPRKGGEYGSRRTSIMPPSTGAGTPLLKAPLSTSSGALFGNSQPVLGRSISGDDKGSAYLGLGGDSCHKRYLSADDTHTLAVGSPLSGGQSTSTFSPSGTDLSSGPSNTSLRDAGDIYFDRAEFARELEELIHSPCAQSYLYLRQLLIRLLLDPKLAVLRDHIAPMPIGDSEFALCQLSALINKVRSWTLPKKNAEAQVQMKKLEQTILVDIEEIFPTYNVVMPVDAHTWNEETRKEKDLLVVNQDAMAENIKKLGEMLRPIASENGLVAGEINNPAAYYRPEAEVPPHPVEGGNELFYIPVEFAFVLDGKSVSLPHKHFQDLARRNFIRLYQAKQNVVSSEEYWKQLTREDQKQIAGEIFNDDFSMSNDTTRFDCKYVMAPGDQLPPCEVFSSREYRTAYQKANLGAATDVATGQMFMEVLRQIGGFNPQELQLVAGSFSQGPVNEVFNYCCAWYFPDRDVAFFSPTVSSELNSDPAKLARMEVINWGHGCLEIICEFEYDRYIMQPGDQNLFNADSKATVKLLAKSSEGKVALAKVTMTIEVDRIFNPIDKVAMLGKRRAALRGNKDRAGKYQEDHVQAISNSQRYVNRTYNAQCDQLANHLVDQKCTVAGLLSSQEEQEAVINLLEAKYPGKDGKEQRDAKVKAVHACLKGCKSLIRPQIGVTRPLPLWLVTVKQEGDKSGAENHLERERCRLIWVNKYGWIATNIPESAIQSVQATPPEMMAAISRDNLLEDTMIPDSEPVPVDKAGNIKPLINMRKRYSSKYKEFEKGMGKYRISPSALTKLAAYFKQPKGTKERELMVKLQGYFGDKIAQPGWENELDKFLDNNDLNEKERTSAKKYINMYFQSRPSFTGKRCKSLSCITRVGVASYDDKPQRSHSGNSPQLKEFSVYPTLHGVSSAISNLNLLHEEESALFSSGENRTPELKVPAPENRAPQLTFTTEDDYDHLDRFDHPFVARLKTLDSKSLRQRAVEEYVKDSITEISSVLLDNTPRLKLIVANTRQENLSSYLKLAGVDEEEIKEHVSAHKLAMASQMKPL